MTAPLHRRRRWTVVQLIPALGQGGAERSTLEVGRALVNAGHRSIVISASGRWAAQLRSDGSHHIKLPVGAKRLSALLTMLRLRTELRRLKPDIVHVRSRFPAWLARFAMIGMRPKPALVSTVHGLNSVSAYSRILTRGDRVIAVSKVAQEHLLRHYPKLDPQRIRVIPRGADPVQFPPGFEVAEDWRKEFYASFPMLSGGHLMTLPGRGTRLKGHGDAIELLARVRAAGVDARLLLLGLVDVARREYVGEMRDLARSLGVERYVGWSPLRGDVREVFAVSDLVLQLSTRPESFGRVVAEALCQGRPVLGYDHGGVGELLRDLYPAGCAPFRDLDALSERAIALLRSAPPVDTSRVPKVADLQRLTLSVYAELIEGGGVDPAFVVGDS